jgi:PTS system nitrogen regulatory IIA component
MKILDVLQKEAILEDLKSSDKKGILEELVAPVAKATNISQDGLVKVLMDREQLGQHRHRRGVGIPHGKLKNLDTVILGFGLSRNGVDFESMDGKPTHIFFPPGDA